MIIGFIVTASLFLTIAACNLNIVSGMAGQISLAHGFCTVGTYTAVLGGVLLKFHTRLSYDSI